VEWVVVGGCCITFMAAMLNVVFLIHLGASVSHLTGDLSRFSNDLLEGGWEAEPLRYLLAALVGFIIGSTISGYFIHHPRLDLERPYGRSIILIGCLIVGCYWMLEVGTAWSVFLASLACGYQNALASRFHGMVLRTTHITGLLTDLGIHIGMKLKGHTIDGWKIYLPGLLVASFFMGSLLGAWEYRQLGTDLILYLGIAYIVGGVGWTVLKRWKMTR